jgi:hypothetical protein
LSRDQEMWSKVFWPPSAMLAAMLKPEATPWDRVFARKQFVRVTLKDGGFVGGYLADGSVVSTYPNDEQIFIKNEHVLDQETGNFGEAIDSTGVLINGSEIKIVEIIEVSDEPKGSL